MSTESPDLAALKELCEKATPEPWERYGDDIWQGDEHILALTAAHDVTADADFIAAARSAVPALIAEVERLQGALDRARRQIPLPPPNPLLGLTVDDEPSVSLASLDADHTDTKEQTSE